MIATGHVTGLGPLIATQMVWGLSWTLASGADVAWITDELDRPTDVAAVLMRAGRAQATGAVAGLGLYVLVAFHERRFVRVSARRWSASWAILVRGSALARGSAAILVMFAATFLVNGVAGTFGRLYPQATGRHRPRH